MEIKRKSVSEDVTIQDLLDVIHWTIIKEEGENSKCLHELDSIYGKIQRKYIPNYKVKETTFWKVITKHRKGPSVWDIKPIYAIIWFLCSIILTFVLTAWFT